MNEEEIKTYLPKYLSADSRNALLDALKTFPNVPADKFYTQKLKGSEIIYQGDGLTGFIHIELPRIDTKNTDAMLLSNTCDMAIENERLFDSRVVYAPIISLEKYKRVLVDNNVDFKTAENHVESIRNQQITQIFYLPGLTGIIKDSIVFFDRILNIRPNYVDTRDLRSRRLFSLSNYGHYLLLFKLSFHFCRFQDKIDRD